MNNSTCAVILAGGQGNRMKSDLPKPMMKVLGIPMLEWVMKACEDAGVTDICVVTGFNSKVVEEYIGSRCACVLQSERLGTAHAVMSARDWLSGREEKDVLILCGDAPFIDSGTVGEALNLHRESGNGVTVITAEAENPTGYGRILRKEGAGGSITGIIEEKNADGVQRAIREVNSGVYWFKGDSLKLALEKITPDGLTGEYYLTDSVSVLIGEGLGAGAYLSANAKVILGANDRMGLLRLNDIARYDIIEKLCKEGVGFLCTDGVYIEPLVKIGKGTEILQGTTIRGNTVIGENCLIGPGSLLEDCVIGKNVVLNSVQAYKSIIGDYVKAGPFVHIRPDSHIKAGAKIGDFVEVKNSTVGENTAIAHLTYVGDSDVGRHVNFGCGVVTVNYNGKTKHRTVIGDEAFIGCNTNLIAPVNVGRRAYTAAGTTVTEDIPDEALAIGRPPITIKKGYNRR